MAATVRGISVDGRQGSVNAKGERDYKVVYKVSTDNVNDGAKEVRQAFGVPQIGDVYSAGNDADTDAVVTNKSVSQSDSPWEWEVEITYSTVLEDEPEQPISPLAAAPKISYGAQTRRIMIPGYFDNAGSPPSSKDFDRGIVAPNGELFDPQPEMDITEPSLTIRRNIATVSGPALMALASTVNATAFFGADARQLKLSIPQVSSQWDKTIGDYWDITYTLTYKWDTWDIQLLNQGAYYWTGGKPADVTSTTPKVKTASGNPIIVNLTTDGDINTTDVPTYTRLRVYREIDFNGLGII